MQEETLKSLQCAGYINIGIIIGMFPSSHSGREHTLYNKIQSHQ